MDVASPAFRPRAAERPRRNGDLVPARPHDRVEGDRVAEPTLEEVRRDYQPRPVVQDEEVAELVGLCLWDAFSDNHDVIAADGRVADIGSFRAAAAFLDEYLTCDSRERLCSGNHMRF